jgi:hypothetical protein
MNDYLQYRIPKVKYPRLLWLDDTKSAVWNGFLICSKGAAYPFENTIRGSELQLHGIRGGLTAFIHEGDSLRRVQPTYSTNDGHYIVISFDFELILVPKHELICLDVPKRSPRYEISFSWIDNTGTGHWLKHKKHVFYREYESFDETEKYRLLQELIDSSIIPSSSVSSTSSTSRCLDDIPLGMYVLNTSEGRIALLREPSELVVYKNATYATTDYLYYYPISSFVDVKKDRKLFVVNNQLYRQYYSTDDDVFAVKITHPSDEVGSPEIYEVLRKTFLLPWE